MQENKHIPRKSPVLSVLTNSFHTSRQSVCKPGWHFPCLIHKQTVSCLKQEIQFLHVPFGALMDSVQGSHSTFPYPAGPAPFPVPTQCWLQVPVSGSWAPLAGLAFQRGSLILSLLPAPLLPALWHYSLPLQHLLSQSTETLTLSAAVHSG